MVAAGGDSSAGLFEPEEFRDGEHLPAAGTASPVADAAGEQLTVWAAAFGGETLAAAGTFVDPGGGAGSAGRHRCPRCRPALPAPPPGSTNVPAAANVSPPNAAAQTVSCSPAASATEEAVPAAGRCSPSRNYSGSNRPAVLSHPAATIVTERSLRPGHLHRRLDATVRGRQNHQRRGGIGTSKGASS